MDNNYLEKRISMINNQILSRGVTSSSVLKVMQKVERHKFVSEQYVSSAYDDNPLPAGYNQTISQPYIVAYMTEMLDIFPDSKILEIGTGTGYQTAILAELSRNVFTIERVKELSRSAKSKLSEMGYKNIRFKVDSGYNGWKENAPFDRIIVTCAPNHIPENLVEQMTNDGIMIIPVGNYLFQNLLKIKKVNHMIDIDELIAVKFVPMI